MLIVLAVLSLICAQTSAVSDPNRFGNEGNDLQGSNPCNSVDCGYGKYCESVPSRYPGGAYTAQCRNIPTWNPNPSGPVTNPGRPSSPVVGQCYDRVEVLVPAAGNNFNRGVVGATSARCLNQCRSNANCGRGRICCMKGCDRICYMPRTTTVDYTRSGPADADFR